MLEAPKETLIEQIHESTNLIEELLRKSLFDIVPAYNSIAVFGSFTTDDLILQLEGKHGIETQTESSDQIIKLPICYEVGLDLEKVAKHAKMSVEEVIDIHLKGIYRSLFIGFTPGFVYADGLDERLACPRLEKPRTHIPEGSIGIAGNQTGLYSLSSPGGWNIIGRTPVAVFDPKRKPIMLIEVGSRYIFHRITKQQFDSWGS